MLNDLSHGGAETFVFSLVSVALNKGYDHSILMLGRGNDDLSISRREAIEGRSGYVFSSPSFLSFVSVLRKEKIAIVHCHNLKALIFSVVAKFFLMARYKVVFTQHTSYLKRPAFHRVIFRYVDAYIAICSVAASSFAEIVPKNKIVIVRNGVNVSREGDSSLRVAGKCNIGMIARFHPVKNHQLLVKSIDILKNNNQIHDFHFTLIGDGSEIESIKSQIKFMGCDDVVNFCGALESASKYIDGFDYLLLCSKNEGMPITILEALAKNTPVIATDVGGVSDLIADSVNGFLVKNDDPQELANVIKVAGMRDSLEKFNNYFSRNEFKMSLSATFEEHLKVYSCVLDEKKGGCL